MKTIQVAKSLMGTKVQSENINTKRYWDEVYKQGIDPGVIKADEFKFENIAHHIVDGMRVIDLGCGTGELCQVIKKLKPRCEVWGVDFSKEAILQAQEQGNDIIYGIDNVVNTSLGSNSFNYVLSLETIEHLDRPEELIKEAARLLKTDGVFILTAPFGNHIPSKEHVWEFNYSDIENLLFKRFKRYWVFPWAAGWTEVREEESKRLVYPKGHWCTIMALAIK